MGERVGCVIPDPLVLATRSADKVRELKDLFRASGRSLITLGELGLVAAPEEALLENADTFEGNALAKARFFAERLDRAVIADDSGLEVAALGGRPGVRSKRWSGRSDLSGRALDEANNARLIAELEAVGEREGDIDRSARYVCVAALCHSGAEMTFRGTTTGRILAERGRGRGRGTSGFGYDPYFLSDELGITFGEASLEQKQSVSHRARAFRALLAAVGRCG